MSESELYFSDVVACARAKVIEAIAVIECATAAIKQDELYGLLNLAEWLDSRFEQHETANSRSFNELSGNTVSVIAVLCLINEDHDSMLLHAANTVLASGKGMLDEAAEKALQKGGAQ